MSWKGNIGHKGFHTYGACGRAAFLHIHWRFYAVLMGKAHPVCSRSRMDISPHFSPSIADIIRAAEYQKIDAASQSVSLSVPG